MADIGSTIDQAFLGQGEYLVTSDGNVWETATGQIVWPFAS